MDAEEVHNHQVNSIGLVHVLEDGGSIIQPGVWRGHTCFRDCLQEVGLVENEGGEIQVRFCDRSLKICRRD